MKSKEFNENFYRQAVGCLTFVAITARPDIVFAVNVASRFQNKPTQAHWNAVKRIIQYLKQTVNYCISYEFGKNINLAGYSDTDYAEDADTRRSTTGYVFLLNGSAITWSSRRQSSVSLSTTEAEFVAGSSATRTNLAKSAVK